MDTPLVSLSLSVYVFLITAKFLLERMGALETYPSYNNRNASEEEYAHVKNHLKGGTCGTLSKSEWEASCKSEFSFSSVICNMYIKPFFPSFSALYMVFAFQKMKKQFNEKGEPEYLEV